LKQPVAACDIIQNAHGIDKIRTPYLLNQYRILAKLEPDDSRNSEEACEILRNGYTLEYEKLGSYVDPAVSEGQCREVKDILDMYRALKIACRDLPEGTFGKGDSVFPGFHGNNEPEYFAYATFLIDTQNKWPESKPDPRNSHRPMLARYRSMLESWEESANKWELTAEDTARILSRKL
jgi:uncharacterized protein YfbU (UPF0304 family)